MKSLPGALRQRAAARARDLERVEKRYWREGPKATPKFVTGGGMIPADFELEGRRILDLAVGPLARVAIPMARGGAHVVCHDISPESLERAAERMRAEGLADRAEFVEGDASALGFADGTFDGVVIFNVLAHFPTKGEALEQLKESARVLKPGGQLYLRDFANALSPLSWQYIFFSSVVKRIARRPGKLHYVTPFELERALRDAGLGIVRREMRLPPRFLPLDVLPPDWHRRAYRPLFPAFRGLEALLRRLRLLDVLGYEYNVLCRKRWAAPSGEPTAPA